MSSAPGSHYPSMHMRGGMKRAAPMAGHDEHMDKKPKNLLDWGVKPIAQQPLPKANPYGAAPMASDSSWYQDSW